VNPTSNNPPTISQTQAIASLSLYYPEGFVTG
jgi:hypothetical protein